MYSLEGGVGGGRKCDIFFFRGIERSAKHLFTFRMLGYCVGVLVRLN